MLMKILTTEVETKASARKSDRSRKSSRKSVCGVVFIMEFYVKATLLGILWRTLLLK